jgi:hypothetical protein
MQQFEEREGGPKVFLAAVCPVGQLAAPAFPFEFLNTLFLPTPENADPRQTGIDPTTPVLRFLLVDHDVFSPQVERDLVGCSVRDEIRGEIRQISRREMLRGLYETDQDMRFVRNLTSYACKSIASDSSRTPIPLTELARAIEEGNVHERDGALQIASLRQPWSYAAKLDLHALRLPHGSADFVFRVQIRRGAMGFGVLNNEGTDYLVEQHLGESTEESTVCLSIPSVEQAGDLVLRNWSTEGVKSEVLIKEASVIVHAAADAPPRHLSPAP